MSLITDKFHKDKLDKFGINIKTKYIVGNNILERNTNGSKNDDIRQGIRCSKEFYKDNKLIHTENIFDSRMEYTFIVNNTINSNYKCINCGYSATLNDFTNGCPYCASIYNIDYTEKDLGSKYTYDLVLKSNKYRIITGIVDLLVSLVLSYLFISGTSRTFNSYDIGKIFIYGFILSLILYYFFYLIDAYFVLGPIRSYKNKLNNKQKEFWYNSKIDKTMFYNNLNYELRKYYYNNEDVIDYDILDYIDFNSYESDGVKYVKVVCDVRIVSYINNKIISKYERETYVMMHNTNSTLELKDGVNFIRCHNCGASINVMDGRCEFCDTDINPLQEWVLKI